MPTAVVIDGAFFLRQFKRTFPNLSADDPRSIAFGVTWLSYWHLSHRIGPKVMVGAIENSGFRVEESPELYRIFFYDCPPLEKKLHRPISKRSIDLKETSVAKFRTAVHKELQTVRKVALRLGRLNDDFAWRIKPEAMKQWLLDTTNFSPTDEDFEPDVKQKGVDMRLGLDVASMAFKKQVNQIVMVAADGDFVPAAKLARREGIDVVLDPLGGQAAKDLLQHVDGVRHCDGRGAVGPINQ